MRHLRKFAGALLFASRSIALLAVQLCGLALVAYGLYNLAPWLGEAAGGVFICVIGWALDGERKPKAREEDN